jgi:hypothetical protein
LAVFWIITATQTIKNKQKKLFTASRFSIGQLPSNVITPTNEKREHKSIFTCQLRRAGNCPVVKECR